MSKPFQHGFYLSAGFLRLIYLPCSLWLLPDRMQTAQNSLAISVVGLAFIILGLLGILTATSLMARFGTGGLPTSRVPDRLVDVGFYARTRHPGFWFFMLYQAGVLVWVLGPQSLSLYIWLGILAIGSSWILFVQEPALQRSLGEPYQRYRNVTPLGTWKLALSEDRKVRFLPQLIWLVGRTVFRAWYDISITGQEHIPHQKPFLVIANHESFLDPFLFGTFIPYEIRFVTTADVFNSAWMSFLLRGIGTFPMRRHRQDLKSIRTMLRMLNEGQVVGIFPEGGRSLYGLPLPILRETLKLIQHCKVPILPVHLDGAYEIWPRWAPNRRRGKVAVSIQPVIPVEDQRDLDTLEALISRRIFAESKTLRPVSSRAIAKGLQNVLWACHNCGSMSTITVTSGHSIECRQCSSSWLATPDYGFVNQQTGTICSIIEWMQQIEADMLEKAPVIHGPHDLTNSERLYLFTPINQYQMEGESPELGKLGFALTSERFILSRGSQIERAWSLGQVTVFTMDYYNAISIGVGGLRHSFFLPPEEVSLKWQTFYDELTRARRKRF